MNYKTIRVPYRETRSMQFQSVEVGAEIEVELEEGDRPSKVIQAVTRAIRQAIRDEAEAAIRDLVARKAVAEQEYIAELQTQQAARSGR